MRRHNPQDTQKELILSADNSVYPRVSGGIAPAPRIILLNPWGLADTSNTGKKVYQASERSKG
jgi:hypothetical protein